MVRNMARYVQARLTDPTPQVHPFPLAIADMDGSMRPSSKSEILQVIQSRFGDMFSDQYMFPDSGQVCVIVDFLYYLHMPPPDHLRTYAHYCTYLWNRAVSAQRSCTVYVVIDNPDFLPPPRELVHKARASKHKGTTPVLPHISEENAMPGSRDFTALLTSADFKACLIRYISQKFVKKARASPNLTLVLDSPAYDTTIMVQHGDVSNLLLMSTERQIMLYGTMQFIALPPMYSLCPQIATHGCTDLA